MQTSMHSHTGLRRHLMGGSRGRGRGSGPPPPLKKYRNIGFPSNIDPDPLKIHKATKTAFNVESSWARQRNAISMAFHWWADDGPFIVIFGSSITSSTKKIIKKNKKKRYQIWTPSDITFWIRACIVRQTGCKADQSATMPSQNSQMSRKNAEFSGDFDLGI